MGGLIKTDFWDDPLPLRVSHSVGLEKVSRIEICNKFPDDVDLAGLGYWPYFENLQLILKCKMAKAFAVKSG